MASRFRTAGELRYRALELGCPLPWSERLRRLGEPVRGMGFTLPNALCAQPMEGNDADENGAPSALALRRYARLAAGGSGLIWLEAVAVCREGLANPRQYLINKENLPAYRKLCEAIHEAAEAAGLPRPVVIVQLTHSGRNTTGTRIAASHHAVMNPHQGLPMDYPIITDEELGEVQRAYVEGAALAREAGFDGVDIKACHLYLLSELLGAKDRQGPYGGDFLGRTKMLRDTVDAVREHVGTDFVYAVRLNVCDAMQGGFCTDNRLEPDMSEAALLCDMLWAQGVTLFNTTMGTPYYNPHVNRPYASHPKGEGYDPPEDPLRGVFRLLSGSLMLQRSLPDAVCVATGLSYLRQYAPYVAVGLMALGGARSIGFGRGWMAYPDYATDIIQHGGMKKEKCCVTCGLCTYLMRRGEAVGCPVRDREGYFDALRRAQAKG